MKISGATTLEQLASIVCDHLSKAGIEAVLTGGAVVAIYTDKAYKSYDLDFITSADDRRIKRAMEELGFHREIGRYFSHPDTDFFVEFPSPPLAIGSRPITSWSVRKSDFGILRLLSPTDCVMDRLAAFYHWGDYEALEQAVAVALKQKIDLDEIHEWSADEKMEDKYTVFVHKLKKQ